MEVLNQNRKNDGKLKPDTSKTLIMDDDKVPQQMSTTGVEESAYLKCQTLIHRLYSRAYQVKFLINEIQDLMVTLSSVDKSNITMASEFTGRLMQAILARRNDSKFEAFFDYTNEQMVALGLQANVMAAPGEQYCEESSISKPPQKPQKYEERTNA